MDACPHCSELTISTWKKGNASSIRPARCSSCAGLSYVSGWYHAATTILGEALFWGGIVAAIAFRSWLVLVAALVCLPVVLLLHGSGAKLRVIDASAVARAREMFALQVLGFACLVLVAYVLFGR